MAMRKSSKQHATHVASHHAAATKHQMSAKPTKQKLTTPKAKAAVHPKKA